MARIRISRADAPIGSKSSAESIVHEGQGHSELRRAFTDLGNPSNDVFEHKLYGSEHLLVGDKTNYEKAYGDAKEVAGQLRSIKPRNIMIPFGYSIIAGSQFLKLALLPSNTIRLPRYKH
jgi:hypothetical protein